MLGRRRFKCFTSLRDLLVLLGRRATYKHYTSIRGLFTLSYPRGWPASEEDGILSLSSPSGIGAVTVSAWKNRSENVIADASEQLQSYRIQFGIDDDRFKEIECSPQLAIGQYVNEEQVFCRVQFRALRNVIVLATYHQGFSGEWHEEDKAVMAILSSIAIQPKR